MQVERQHLVFTGSEDQQEGHVPFVQRHMDTPLLVIDPEREVIEGRSLSYESIRGVIVPVYDGQPLDNVVSAWLRRPTHLAEEDFDRIHPAFRKYSLQTVRGHADQLYGHFDSALWVSDRFAIEKAELKTRQLSMASRLGFNIPDTLVTSDLERAKRFIAEHPATIIKSYSVEFPSVGDREYYFFSSRVTPDTPMDLRQMAASPLIFQEAIEVDYDLRITVVGDDVFAARVNVDPENRYPTGYRPSVCDWRFGKYTVEAYDGLAEDTGHKCRALVKELGLNFGAIDMIVDKRGKFWFIEINPNGQWAFVEEEAGLEIGKSMARLLLEPIQNL